MLLLISTFVMVGSFVIKLQNLPPQLPLFYSQGDGEAQMADSYWIFLLPILSILLVIINTFIKNKFFKENLLVEKIIYYTNLGIIIFISLIFLKILLLIT